MCTFCIKAAQISTTAWGKYVSSSWTEQDDRVARADAWLAQRVCMCVCVCARRVLQQIAP